MKKISFNLPWTITFLFTLLLCLALSSAATAAQPALSVGDIAGTPGEILQVPVSLESNGEVVAMQFELNYDPGLLTYLDTSAGSLTSAPFIVSANLLPDNKVAVIIMNLSNTPVPAGSGTVAQLQFKVADSAQSGQSAPLELSGVTLSDSDGKAITYTYTGGQFTVGSGSSNSVDTDTKEPTWPSGSGLSADNVKENSLDLNWTAAADNKGVKSYKIYLEGELLVITGTDKTVYHVPGLTPGTSYTFKVEAGDARGNWSSDGPSVTVKTAGSHETGQDGGTGSGGSQSGASGSGGSQFGAGSGGGSLSGAGGDSAGASFPKTFADIQGHWAQQDIELMLGRNIVKGMPDSTFSPDNNITRAEFATLLVRALAINGASPEQGQFADVSPSEWYFESVEAAAAAGLVKGLGDNEFAPKALITREQMAVMITRALNYAGVNSDLAAGEQEQLLAVFSDIDKISAWSAASLAQAVKAGLINGATPNTMEPVANATRAQATVMIKRMMEKAGRL